MINHIILVGRLGADPEEKTIGGSAVAKLSLATTESWKDKDGDWQEKTEWHNIDVWGRQAETAVERFHKGDTVYVEGQLRYFKAKDGKSKVASIRALKVRSLGGKKGEANGHDRDYDPPKKSARRKDDRDNRRRRDDYDEIPF